MLVLVVFRADGDRQVMCLGHPMGSLIAPPRTRARWQYCAMNEHDRDGRGGPTLTDHRDDVDYRWPSTAKKPGSPNVIPGPRTRWTISLAVTV
jgi:hypothetical protein